LNGEFSEAICWRYKGCGNRRIDGIPFSVRARSTKGQDTLSIHDAFVETMYHAHHSKASGQNAEAGRIWFKCVYFCSGASKKGRNVPNVGTTINYDLARLYL
jgi:hypothetical protein